MLEDGSDRAQKHRKVGNMRIHLDKIGFWPDNRGGVGCQSYHVHEVAFDCKTHKTKLSRYEHVAVVEVPSSALQGIRDANRELCQGDALMPRFSSEIQYICVSKTHFVHCHKLAKDGNRYLFNDASGSQPSIVWQKDDAEGNEILEQRR